MNPIQLIFPLAACGFAGMILLCYKKVFGEKRYKIIKDYEYKKSRIQLIKNPQNNICPQCFDVMEENKEICRFTACDHHFCESCIHQQVDESQGNLLTNIYIHPCSMCMSHSNIKV